MFNIFLTRDELHKSFLFIALLYSYIKINKFWKFLLYNLIK